MTRILLVALLTVSTCAAQEPMAGAGQPSAPAPQPGLAIPAGTQIPLALASPIMAKSARAGSPVRAITQFPVTVGNQVAMPVGTFVEGVIDKVVRSHSTRTLQMHFTRIVFANGYSVTVDGSNLQADALPADSTAPEPPSLATTNEAEYALAAQQSPTVPPLKTPGPSIGVAVGAGVGVLAAGIVAAVLIRATRAEETPSCLIRDGNSKWF